jgi:hypothetical protein
MIPVLLYKLREQAHHRYGLFAQTQYPIDTSKEGHPPEVDYRPRNGNLVPPRLDVN